MSQRLLQSLQWIPYPYLVLLEKHGKMFSFTLKHLIFVSSTDRQDKNANFNFLFLHFFESSLTIWNKYKMFEKLLEIKDSQHSFFCSFTTASVLAV